MSIHLCVCVYGLTQAPQMLRKQKSWKGVMNKLKEACVAVVREYIIFSSVWQQKFFFSVCCHHSQSFAEPSLQLNLPTLFLCSTGCHTYLCFAMLTTRVVAEGVTCWNVGPALVSLLYNIIIITRSQDAEPQSGFSGHPLQHRCSLELWVLNHV